MTAKEYLSQAKFLDLKINHHIRRKDELHRLASSISSPVLEADKVQTSPSNEAPYVRTLMKVLEMEEKINEEIDLLVDLKEQIHSALNDMKDQDQATVLRLHFLDGLSFMMIADEMHVSKPTVKRWNKDGLANFNVPKNFIVI